MAVSDISNIQLELGSTATTYEPYDPNRTVYGGWVDLISGEVQEEYILLDKPWSEWGNRTVFQDGSELRYIRFNLPVKGNSQNNFKKSLCNVAKYVYGNNDGSTHYYIVGNSYNCRVYLPIETDENTRIQVLGELVSPISYYVPPTQLQTFLGQNNVWSNADYVEVEYDLYETEDILRRKQFIIANQPHIETLTPAPLQSFNTDVVAPLKECKVYFNPIQEGEGTPSPNNVMAITGWNEMTISQSQRQVIQDATNEDWTVGWLTAGGILNASASYRTSDYIPVLSGTTVKIKFTNQTSERAWYCIAYYDSQKKFLIRNNQGYITEDITCTVSYEGLEYIRISINRASDVLISIGSITTNLIDWSSTGTVYGGYIDLLTGEVWKTWDIVSSSVLSDWLLNRTSLLYQSGKAIRCYCPENGPETATKWTVQCTHFSDVGPVGNWAKDAENKDGYVVEAQGRSILFIASDLGFTTKEEWAQWMVDNNVQYVYPLAAPVLITMLTPTQLKTLRGINNIWSNSNGDITVQFWTH